MKPELAFDESELGRCDQPLVGNPDPVERAIEVSSRKIQEIDKLRKVRRQVVVLPNIGL
jgi:hypothetical protein